MGESRLEKGLKVAAWAVLAATVAALLAVGLLVQTSATAAPAVETINRKGRRRAPPPEETR